MAKGFFVTGTGTGVGKTVITAALIKAVNLLGFRSLLAFRDWLFDADS